MKNKEFVGFEELTKQELWTLCMAEYDNSNPLVKYLINNFYTKLEQIIEKTGDCKSYFEVGCGAGESSKRIHKMLSENKKFEASDFDKRYVELLNEKKMPFPVSQQSIYEIQKADNAYDCVICLEVMEHLEYPEKAVKELFRVASKSVIISVPNEPIWRILNMTRLKYLKDYGNTPGHLNHFNAQSITKLIENYGTVRKISKPLPWLIVHIDKGYSL
jgi:2-polyprenyl-3-methyl-5-hydroxy-6-metoxy-1,4-benzoquinol methylase